MEEVKVTVHIDHAEDVRVAQAMAPGRCQCFA
jgi:hypothetical protein